MVVFIILFGVMVSQVYSTGQNIPFVSSFLYVNYSSTRLLKKNSNRGSLTPEKTEIVTRWDDG